MKISLAPFAAFAPVAQPRVGATGTAAAPLSKAEEIAARKLQEAKSAVATLATIKTKTSDDERARAAQKVKELKARLQALKMIYASDPKKLAKAAAQIARELAAAVKSYTSAGGSTIELGGENGFVTIRLRHLRPREVRVSPRVPTNAFSGFGGVNRSLPAGNNAGRGGTASARVRRDEHRPHPFEPCPIATI